MISPERLDFSEAIAYFAQKLNLDTDTWVEGQGIVQDAAFTVAAAKGALLQEIRDAVDRALAEGKSVQEFLKDFDTIADRWSDDWNRNGNRAWRGQLIYEQNLRNAYAAGRYVQMTEPGVMKLRPYWQWRHGGSRDPRPAHLALDGLVFEAGKLPFHPPGGFNCRCKVFSLSRRDLERKGLKVSSLKRGDMVEVLNPKTGERQKVKLEADPGFGHIPGTSTQKQREAILRKLSPSLGQHSLPPGSMQTETTQSL